MDAHDLPAGMAGTLAAAVRALVLACAGHGETGPQAVERLTGARAGTISRWVNFDRPELPPLAVIAYLEWTIGRPIVTEALAGLTGRRLGAGGGSPGVACMTAAALAFSGSAGRALAELAESLEDGELTATEARVDLAELDRHLDKVHAVRAHLARVAEGGGA